MNKKQTNKLIEDACIAHEMFARAMIMIDNHMVLVDNKDAKESVRESSMVVIYELSRLMRPWFENARQWNPENAEYINNLEEAFEEEDRYGKE